jgi:mannose-1-phosphate guanylyltransferase
MLPSSNIIEEPLSRDTAACVGLSALTLEKDGDDPVFCVLPADHYIEPKERFQKALSAGYKFACDGLIVTIGIKPSYPSTHLGYLQKGSTLDKIDGINVYQLRKFCEKPTEKSATRFISTKEYFWNSGIFMWKASTILSAIRRFMPDMQGGLMKIKESLDSPSYNQILKDEYEKFRRISIDFGVMEKIDNGVIVEGDFQWDDLGSFLSMAKYREKDSDGNVIEGLVCRINTKDSIVISESDHLLATLGIKDMIVVHTKDATLICPKEKIGAIKSIIEKIEAEGLKRFL